MLKFARRAPKTLLALASAFGLLWSVEARAKKPVPGPEMNPFACQGLAETYAKDRTSGQLRDAIERLSDPPYAQDDPQTLRAHKLCAIAEMKRRVGAGDADEYYERAIETNPDEPGYELLYAYYWRNVRGAGAPILEKAETHYYRALEKLEALRKSGRYRPYHEIVEEYTRKGLMLLYEQDGLALLPWKAYPQHPSGYMAPGLSVSSQFHFRADTRGFFDPAEARAFAAEQAFSESPLRRDEQLSAREVFNIPRARPQIFVENRIRLRHNYVGALDFLHKYFLANDLQISEFANPVDSFVDLEAQEVGVGYNRSFDLYPLFDLRVSGAVKRMKRTGYVEFQPAAEQEFNVFEATPVLSRSIGADKLSLGLVYVYMGIPDLTTGRAEERARGRAIRGASLTYSIYSPVLLPQLHLASLRPYRTYTRGWHFYGGVVQDDEVFGLRTVTKRDFYLGTRLEGPGAYDVTLQGNIFTSGTTFVSVDDPTLSVQTDDSQTITQYRTNVTIARRLINPDATPGIPSSFIGFAPDLLTLVVPLSHDLAIDGTKDYDNVRGGIELWYKMFSPGLWGTTFLLTAGYDYQYFYRIVKSMHMGHVSVRMGW